MYIHLYIKVSLIVIRECNRTVIQLQDTLKPWCLGKIHVTSLANNQLLQAVWIYYNVFVKKLAAHILLSCKLTCATRNTNSPALGVKTTPSTMTRHLTN